MTVYLVISLPKIPCIYIHSIFMVHCIYTVYLWFWPTLLNPCAYISSHDPAFLQFDSHFSTHLPNVHFSTHLPNATSVRTCQMSLLYALAKCHFATHLPNVTSLRTCQMYTSCPTLPKSKPAFAFAFLMQHASSRSKQPPLK
jgi:hypothetical protein